MKSDHRTNRNLRLAAKQRTPRVAISKSTTARGSSANISEPLARLLVEALNPNPSDSRAAAGTPAAAGRRRNRGTPTAAALGRVLGQLAPGQILEGSAGSYAVLELERLGEHCETYVAQVLSMHDGSSTVPAIGEQVVVKIPRVPEDMTDVGASHRLRILVNLFRAESHTLMRLQGVPRVATFVDSGTYAHRLQSGPESSVFVVQQHVKGVDLEEYLASQFGTGGVFCGIADDQTFFRWARLLTSTLMEIHRRLVVHGYIWPKNLLVNQNREPVFVDFGESLFAQTMGPAGHLSYLAPERGWNESSDLFSLGGVLFYLATGDDPPRPYDNIDALKEQIEDVIRKANYELYRRNCGVVDIIARCLRLSSHGRVQTAAELLRDIETLDRSAVSDRVEHEAELLVKDTRSLDREGNSLLRWMAVLQMRELRGLIDGMKRGAYDLTAPAAEIRGAAARLMNILKEGDMFVAISIVRLWWPENMGINGRFLSMNRAAAARGVKVRRVFLLDEAHNERHVGQILDAQRRVATELGSSANHSVRYIEMPSDECQRHLREGKHFGLFIRQGEFTAMFPQYGADGTLETLRFRSDPGVVCGLYDTFEQLYAAATPLADLTIRQAKVV